MSNFFAGILIGAGAIIPGISSRRIYVLIWIVRKNCRLNTSFF